MKQQNLSQENLFSSNALSKVFEQYEFKGWIITIQNYSWDSEELIGFATPTKCAHLLNKDNYHLIDDIAEENQIEIEIDEDGCEYYKDLNYVIADPFDIVVNSFEQVNVESASSVLSYIVNEIIREIGIDHPKTIVLKQIYKKTTPLKSGKRKNGFLNQAWAALVKERDRKCRECGSVYDLHAHHVKPYKSYPELRTDVNNGITLCGTCHRKWHFENGK